MKKRIISKINLPLLVISWVILLAVVQLVLTHRLATSGEAMKELEIKSERLKEKNELLKEETTALGSLRRIAQKAEEMGFVAQNNLLPLKPEIPVAMNY
jgi:cell division protein FtsL